MASFPTYGGEKGAKQYADNLVKGLAKGSQVTALHPAQARDALAALERLQSHFQATGRRVSLLSGISVFCEADAKLNGRTVTDAIDGFLTTVASVKRKDISEAVAEFLLADAPRTKAADGQRAQLSAKYAYNRKIQLEKFASAFPNTAICDLSKEHLDKFIESLAELKTKSRNKRKAVSAKSRNHYRASIRQFLQWAARKDYLRLTHRLFEADAMRPEHANNAAVEFYTPDELAALLSAAKDDLSALRPIIAIGGLAGLRTAELLRLDWADVWRVPGYIEITAGNAKTRQRRLVEICPVLAAWLELFHKLTKGKLWISHEITFQQHFVELCKEAEVKRKANGLRHAFCTYHFAANANENQTAQQAGNSPAMIHAHYKGLATKAEAEKWFNVTPPKAAKNVIRLLAAAKTTTL
jgi:integrase